MAVNYPFGDVATATLAASGAQTLTITSQETFVSTPAALSASFTLTVAVGSQVKAGAKLHFTVLTTATETVTFAGSLKAPAVQGAAGKTWSQSFAFNGTNFYPCGAKIQVD